MRGNQIAARRFKALGDETRLGILKILAAEEQCACRLLEHLAISQPTLSHHMKILDEAGLISYRRDGKWTRYRLREEGWRELLLFVQELSGPWKGEQRDE